MKHLSSKVLVCFRMLFLSFSFWDVTNLFSAEAKFNTFRWGLLVERKLHLCLSILPDGLSQEA